MRITKRRVTLVVVLSICAALAVYSQLALSGTSPSSAPSPAVSLSTTKPLDAISAFGSKSAAPLLSSSTISPSVQATFGQFNAEVPPANAPADFKASFPGTVDVSRARSLVSLGSSTLVGAPTANSRVCLVLDSGEFASCPSALTTAGISIAKATEAGPNGTIGKLILYGIASDGVTSVKVHFADGHTESATLANNGYLYIDPTPSNASQIDDVVVDGPNGTSTVPIP